MNLLSTSSISETFIFGLFVLLKVGEWREGVVVVEDVVDEAAVALCTEEEEDDDDADCAGDADTVAGRFAGGFGVVATGGVRL